jgi:hypothetical protein
MCRLSWSGRLRAEAARDNKVVFACAFDRPRSSRFSRSHVFGTLDPSLASALFSFACSLRAGRSPREAFDSINWPETNLHPDGSDHVRHAQ